jgi:hypothetical protein
VDALLQAGEVQPALPPQHQFSVEHDGGVELFEGGDDLGEVAGEWTLLAGLQGNPIGAPVGEAAEAVELGLIGPPPTRSFREAVGVDRDHRAQRKLHPRDPRRLSTHLETIGRSPRVGDSGPTVASPVVGNGPRVTPRRGRR